MHHLPVRRGGRFVVALGMGGMGYSFGAAIGDGLRAGTSDRTVVIAGDGAFFMHGMELHTAIQYGLPVTVRAVQQQRPRHVRHPRAAVLRRPVQLQPVHAEPSRRRPGRDVPRAAIRRRRRHRRELPARAATRARVDGPSVVSIECSADEIPPFAPFLAFSNSISDHQGDDAPCRCPRLTISPARADRRGRPDRERAARDGHADHHGDDAVGVPARPGLRRVLHRQRLHRLPAATSCSNTWPTPAAWRSGPTACAASRPPRSRACGWPTTGWARRPRSTPAPSPTARP